MLKWDNRRSFRLLFAWSVFNGKTQGGDLMKKIIVLLFAVSVVVVSACVTPPAVNPEVGPELTVVIPELFSPDPDVVDDKLVVDITVKHPVKIKEWTVQVNRSFGGQAGQAPAADRPPRQAQDGEARQPRERAEGDAPRRSRAFYEHTGRNNPPAKWLWDGKSSRQSAEMVQSATDYRFVLTVTDIFDNSSTYEGIISVDVLVKREGNDYRIIVPSIIFPPNAASFSLLSEDDMRSNRRVLRLIAGALNRFPDYKITVEGHANPTTPEGSPQRARDEEGTATEIGLRPLSQQRAQAVVDYLVNDPDRGVDQSRLTAVGMGGGRTVAAYDDDDENWKNRRVEFLLHR
jgi:outer membrane protein OmpA-like peptidoglycan-associated protein